MDIEVHKNNLKKYIEEDISFKEPLKNISDFDKYCYNHCLDIKTVLEELDNKDKIINEMAKVMKSDGIVFYGGRSHKHIIEYFTKKVEGK